MATSRQFSASSQQSTALSSIFSNQSSPASLALSEIGSEILSEDTMDENQYGGKEDANAVMAQVLSRMDRIVEHLRSKGEQAAANGIAKNTIAIIDVFNEVTAPWDIQTSTLESIAPAPPDNTPSSSLTQSDFASPRLQSSGPSWAAVAAVAPAAGNRLIKYTPSDGVQTKYVEMQATPGSGNIDNRVVWIRGWTENRKLKEITNKVGSGPIYSIAYSPKDDSICIVFQYASSAKALSDDDAQYTKENGSSRFGPGCDVIIGLAYPENEDICRMMPPHNERRRLTFARQQLFTNGMTEAKFKSDMYSIVGESNVELVWLFNTGNATVVFAAVPIARMVREEFMSLSRKPNSPYRGITISFSHDPCERPMSLITQMPAGQADRSLGFYGSRDANHLLPPNIPIKDRAATRRNTRTSDADGWMTVRRR